MKMSPLLDKPGQSKKKLAALAGSLLVTAGLVMAPAAMAIAAPAASAVTASGVSATVGGTANVAPAVAADPFNAQCAGDTTYEPSIAESDGDTAGAGRPWADLTLVDANRLKNYNAGLVVPLYSVAGDDYSDFPPLCGVHYDTEADAPVAEWMFCTDISAHACGLTDADGNLISQDGEFVGPMEPRDGNERLSAEQQRLIGSLIKNGYPLVGNFDIGGLIAAGPATASGSSEQRVGLQLLIWCVSDTRSPDTEFGAFCEENMNAAEQAGLLAEIPVTPVPQISVISDVADPALTAGSTGSLQLTSNVYNRPITLTVTPGAVLTLCEPNAAVTLVGNVLTITGTDASVSTAVALCVTSEAEGTVSVAANVTADAADGIVWNQGLFPGDGTEMCQHYAAYFENGTVPVSDTDELVFVEDEETTTGTTTGETTGTTTGTTTGETTGTTTGETTGTTTGETTGTTTGETTGTTTGTAGGSTTGTTAAPDSGLAHTGAENVGLFAGLAGGALLLGAVLFLARRRSAAGIRS